MAIRSSSSDMLRSPSGSWPDEGGGMGGGGMEPLTGGGMAPGWCGQKPGGGSGSGCWGCWCCGCCECGASFWLLAEASCAAGR